MTNRCPTRMLVIKFLTTQKVDDIREETSKAPTLDIPAGTSVKFEMLTPVSTQEVVELFQSLNSKACDLDLIP